MRCGDTSARVPAPHMARCMRGIGASIIILAGGWLIGGAPPGDTLAALFYVPHALSEIDFSAVAVGALTLAVVFYWPKELGRYVPAPLAALILATLAGLALRPPVLGDIPSGLPSLHLPVFERDATLLVLEAGLILAVLGAIDSLLTSLVADNVTRTRQESTP